METQESKILEWIKDAETSDLPISIEPIRRTYDVKLVAWIDVLGMRNKIALSEDAEEILVIMGKLQNYVSNACYELAAKDLLNYLQISDGFIIIADLKCLDEICEILCHIQWLALVDSCELLRGAVTAGKISITDDSKLIVGPAFIEAFALESENAIFPRILFSNEILQYVPYDNIKFQHIVKDTDNFFYLDFLEYIVKKENYQSKTLNYYLQTQGVKALLKKGYEENLKTKKNISQKHGWLISKLLQYKVEII